MISMPSPSMVYTITLARASISQECSFLQVLKCVSGLHADYYSREQLSSRISLFLHTEMTPCFYNKGMYASSKEIGNRLDPKTWLGKTEQVINYTSVIYLVKQDSCQLSASYCSFNFFFLSTSRFLGFIHLYT